MGIMNEQMEVSSTKNAVATNQNMGWSTMEFQRQMSVGIWFAVQFEGDTAQLLSTRSC